MVKIITDIGYCYGVEEAIHAMEEAAKEGKQVLLSHPLIHNRKENGRLMEANHAVFFSEGMKEEKDSIFVFSAHGHTLPEEEKMGKLFQTKDATCPLIVRRYKSIQREDGVSYVYLGKKDHQETLGFLSHFPYFLFLDSSLPLPPQIRAFSLLGKIAFVPQTTIGESLYMEAKSLLSEKGEIVFSLPICPIYGRRLDQAVAFFKNEDPESSYFIVVGDPSSSNAREILSGTLASSSGLQGRIALSPEEIPQSIRKTKNLFLSSATSTSKEEVLRFVEGLSCRS
jgi:4-hydroxy-3-methylbut-2-enyl diphosphate reductase